MMLRKKHIYRTASLLFCGLALKAQAPAPEPDVLELNDGERLVGKLLSAAGASVKFHSDAAGDVTIDWAKVKTLKSSSNFAVAEKGVVLDKHADLAKIPQGTLSVTDQKIALSPAGGSAVVVPVADAGNVVPQPDFVAAFKTPRLTQNWHGSAGLGIDIVAATQKSRNITAGVSLARVVSGESWISPRYRTTFDFNLSDGQLSQRGQTTIHTDIINANLEHDMYLSKRLFAFVTAGYLHSLSQGMKLQQTYGGGLGYVVFKDEHQELDAKGSIVYIRQQFEPATPPLPDKSLIGAQVGETYRRNFKDGIALNQGFTFIPAFNDSNAYTYTTFLNLAIPISKRFLITLGGIDNYVNLPPAGFKKNSFEFVTQLAYKIN